MENNFDVADALLQENIRLRRIIYDLTYEFDSCVGGDNFHSSRTILKRYDAEELSWRKY